MTMDEAPAPSRPGRVTDLLTLDPVVTPRWLRERRRAERLAARPDALAADLARQIRSLTRPGRPRTIGELMIEQGVGPVDVTRFLDREPMPDEEWDPFFAAIVEAKGR